MRQLLLSILVACACVANSAARRGSSRLQPSGPSPIAGIPGAPVPKSAGNPSEYFFYFLKPSFPNEERPTTSLTRAQFVGMDLNGDPRTPVRFGVDVVLQDSASGTTQTCRAIVHIGNPTSGDLYSLYFGEEADLYNCS